LAFKRIGKEDRRHLRDAYRDEDEKDTPSVWITVDRENIWERTLKHMLTMTPEDMTYYPIKIKLEKESGIDE
jgi:hypothetical protein